MIPETNQGRSAGHTSSEANALTSLSYLRGGYQSWLATLLDLKNDLSGTVGWKHTMLGSLPPPLAISILRRVGEEVRGPRLEAALDWVLNNYPQQLRLKEVLESLECFRHIASFAAPLIRAGKLTKFYDLCGGHGLLSVFLAFRFPHTQIVCVDLKSDQAFRRLVEGVTAVCDSQEALPVDNVSFLQADINTVWPERTALCVCVHGCNEVSKTVLTRANEVEARYAVVPCCIRDKLYDVALTHMGSADTKYNVTVGLMAGLFKAKKVLAIHPGVSPRNLMILG